MSASPAARTYPALDVTFERGIAPTMATGADAPLLSDLLSALLEDLHPAAVHEVDTEDPLRWRVFFPSAEAREAAQAAVAAAFGGAGIAVAKVDVPDEDWAARSQAALGAVQVGRVVVAPPWDVPPPDGGAERAVVVIKPSTGFGTGHHESTRLCLELLQQCEIRGRRVLDVGTGSGVLALASLRLGASAAVGIDEDPEAVAAAQENAVLNGLEAGVTFAVADLRAFRTGEPPDVLLANLTGGLLVNVAGVLASLVRAGGTIVVAGFERREAADVLQAFAPYAEPLARPYENGWEAARLRRHPHSAR
jgi:ribosomal protein L11 methyltransferase